MISILVRERVLGAALGSVVVGALVLEQRMGIYRSLPDTTFVRYELQGQERIFGRNSSDFVHMWNKAVDETLGPVVAYLSSRRDHSGRLEIVNISELPKAESFLFAST